MRYRYLPGAVDGVGRERLERDLWPAATRRDPASGAGITFIHDFYSVGNAGTRSVLFYSVLFYDTGQALVPVVLKLSRVVRWKPQPVHRYFQERLYIGSGSTDRS